MSIDTWYLLRYNVLSGTFRFIKQRIWVLRFDEIDEGDWVELMLSAACFEQDGWAAVLWVFSILFFCHTSVVNNGLAAVAMFYSSVCQVANCKKLFIINTIVLYTLKQWQWCFLRSYWQFVEQDIKLHFYGYGSFEHFRFEHWLCKSRDVCDRVGVHACFVNFWKCNSSVLFQNFKETPCHGQICACIAGMPIMPAG